MREEKLKVSKPYDQPLWEVIACVYDVNNRKWTCFSVADVSPGEKLWKEWKKKGYKVYPEEKYKHEILEVPGKKRMVGDEECICFKPEEGEVTWISFGKTLKESRDKILQDLFNDIKSVTYTGYSSWNKK